MQNPPVYNPNDPDIYLPYSDNTTSNTTSNTTHSPCHLCNWCQIEKGSDIRCRCGDYGICERHKKDKTIVLKNDTTIKNKD